MKHTSFLYQMRTVLCKSTALVNNVHVTFKNNGFKYRVSSESEVFSLFFQQSLLIQEGNHEFMC